jgi:ABC-type glycerol-3-phosphate transport system permease component
MEDAIDSSGVEAAEREVESKGAGNRVRRSAGVWLTFLALAALLLLFAAPFVYMVTGSFKLNSEIFSYPLRFLPSEPTPENYRRLLSGEEIPFLRQFFNSSIVTVSQTLLALLISSMVGWGFAKYEFRGKRPLFIFLLATLMFPYQVTLVPLFLMMVRFGWLDTYRAIVLPGALSAFGVFLMRQSMVSVSNELLDAARIDGSSEFGLYWRIGLPLSRAALAVLAVLTFLGAWNDYLWPLIVLRTSEKFTYPLGLATLVGLYKVEYGMILAGALIATVPILIIFLAGRKQFVAGLTAGAVKG